jgi:hypothetical protein
MFLLFFGIGIGCIYFGYSMYATIDQIADMLGGRQVLGTWALFEHMKQTGAIYMIMLMSFAAFALGFANIAAGIKKNIRPHVRTPALVAAILYGLYSSTTFLPPILGFFVSFAFPRPYVGPREVILLPIYMFGVSVFSFFASWAVHQQSLAEQAEKVAK